MSTQIMTDPHTAVEAWLDKSYDDAVAPTLSCREPSKVTLTASPDAWIIQGPTAAEDVAKVLKAAIDAMDYRTRDRGEPTRIVKGISDGKYWLRKNGLAQCWGPLIERAARTPSAAPAAPPAPPAPLTPLQKLVAEHDKLVAELDKVRTLIATAEQLKARLPEMEATIAAAAAAVETEKVEETKRAAVAELTKAVADQSALAAKIEALKALLYPPAPAPQDTPAEVPAEVPQAA